MISHFYRTTSEIIYQFSHIHISYNIKLSYHERLQQSIGTASNIVNF